MATVTKGVRITGAERERLTNTLRKKYEKGASLRELAEQTGRSYGFVHRVLTDAGVALRGRGGVTRETKK
jgi:predicted transcriptional regulator